MPVLHVRVAPLQSPERYRALAHGLSALSTRILGKKLPLTAVLVEDLPAARWFVADEAAEQPTAFVEIHISAGTNTADEKAAFIEAAYAELERQLGARLHEVSYVIVHEVPKSDWGYGGLTQAARLKSAAPV